MHHTNLWSTKLFYLIEGLHCTCIFRTCVFHPCRFVLVFSVHAFSILAKCAVSYLPFPYLHFPVLAFSAPPEKARYKRNVFNLDLKTATQLALRTVFGSEFQTAGAQHRKTSFANVVVQIQIYALKATEISTIMYQATAAWMATESKKCQTVGSTPRDF